LVDSSPIRITHAIEKRKPIIFCAVDFEARALKRAIADSGCEVITIGIKAGHLPTTVPTNAIIIMAGLAGALDPSLKIGDILIDSSSDILLKELSLPYPRALIHTADAIVPTPATRAALFAQTGARAVDMENTRVRAFAKTSQIPYLGIRAISDAASDTLNPAIARFIDDRGNVKTLALTRELLKNPALALQLNHLRKTSTLAVTNLAHAVRTILDLL
jgi:adenosylhomocysteine nucleosidase